ncbi:MAG: YihY/virulence factor BrkB family protein [Amnibacterium sp.]
MSATPSQGVRDSVAPETASGVRTDVPEHPTGFAGLVQRVLALRPVRVVVHYTGENGPLIASGMTYQALFALFAALWFAFSVAGFVVEGDPQLQQVVFRGINRFIPRLIAYTDAQGTVHPGAVAARTLLERTGLSISTAISLAGVLLTTVGFLGTLRTAIRIMFGLPGPRTNPVLLKLMDVGYTAGFGAVVLLTTVISLVSNTALGAVARFLGFDRTSPVQQIGATAVSSVVLLLIDTLLVAVAFRVLSGIPVPRRRLLVGALIGGVGLAALQTLGTSLLGGASRNPVLSTFATIVGLLLYFNFICQVLLVAASWIAVGMQDAHIDARSLSKDQRELDEAERLEDARRLVAKADRQALEQRVREARGIRRWRLVRALQREVRAEARRRARVPTPDAYERAQAATGRPMPDEDEIASAPRPD